MGAFRTASRIAAAAIAALLLAGCSISPAYDLYRVVAARVHHAGALHAAETSLDGRFRPVVLKYLPAGTVVGHVRCARIPDPQGEVPETCSIAAGKQTYPIIALYDPADKHLNAALAVSTSTRDELQKALALRLTADFGVKPQVACEAPMRFFAEAGSRYACTLRDDDTLGTHASVTFLDDGYWLVPVTRVLPSDESALRTALARDPSHVPGNIVAPLLYRRLQREARLHQVFGPVKTARCPQSMDMRPGRIAACGIYLNGQWTGMQVAFAERRLAWRSIGTALPMSLVRQSIAAGIHKADPRIPLAAVKVDCASTSFILIASSDYHYCDISAPPAFHKRMVIAGLDDEGHYDMFFTSATQAASAAPLSSLKRLSEPVSS